MKFAVKFLLALAAFSSVGAHAGRVWNFTGYSSMSGAPVLGGEFNLGDVDQDGNARVSIFMGRSMMTCVRGRVLAKVEETAAATVVTVPAGMVGCDPTRYTILKDGSGGYSETFVNNEWQDKKNREMTPK